MRKFYLFCFLALSISAAAQASEDTCIKDGKIRYRMAGKPVLESASYCFNEKRSTLVSLSCHDNDKCAAIAATKKKVPMKDLVGQYGSPGFKLCFQYKGIPQIMEFYDGAKWWELDRCQFSQDNSYIDTGTLIGRMNAKK